MNIETLLKKLEGYSNEDLDEIIKAYRLAEDFHKGQYRESGEEYIIHPLNVAYILSELQADKDTICAGLLHDTIEDTKLTKEDIASMFNITIAHLVDGVTKLSKLNFSTKEEMYEANTRKIITGITDDVRIIFIKLADRLHNMRTLEFKPVFKQKENSIETMDIFVPLAYYTGAYRIKSELEDLALKYLKPEIYKSILEKRKQIEIDSKDTLMSMKENIESLMILDGMSPEIKIRMKNVYGIYRAISEGKKISDIHDLLALKIMVEKVSECYRALGIVHSQYHPVNSMFKDYIYNPKTNMYRSIHSTVFGPDERLVQTQIRTIDMDRVASFGLMAYWDIHKGNARNLMQEELRTRYQFFESLLEINSVFGDNQEFVRQVKEELFADKIYVYTSKGEIIELPKGATVIDFAYKIHTEIGDTMVYAMVNEKKVEPDHVLDNNDRVRVITDVLSFGPRQEWLSKAVTTKARRRINEFNKN